MTAADTLHRALCRDCAAVFDGAGFCPSCGGARIFRHAELNALAIAHVDCDAFFAAVEKRDDPTLRDRPVIVGGGRRGVVAACCYVARRYGVRSAMPMFKALDLCPKAVVVRPDHAKYAAVGRRIRTLMTELTPLVEPLSIDEAFLDLSGTERLHGGSPAQILVRLVRRIEDEVGVTASVGLSYNKFLAKVASDLDKPRGFAAIGRAEAADFLKDKPVGLVWGVGAALQKRLNADGVWTIGQLRGLDARDLARRYGVIGLRLAQFAVGQDSRRVEPGGGAKSISAETTFDADIRDVGELKRRLWPLCEKTSARLKAQGLYGAAVTLKLKTADFRLSTRSRRLEAPSNLAEDIWRGALPLLEREADGRRFRLIGVGCDELTSEPGSLLALADPERERRTRVEAAMDVLRGKFGAGAIAKGRSWTGDAGGENG